MRHTLLLIVLITAVIGPGCEARLHVEQTPLAPPEIAAPPEMTDELVEQIEDRILQLEHVDTCSVELEEDDQHGHSISIVCGLSRKISYAAGRELATQAIVIAQDALEPGERGEPSGTSGPDGSLRRATWHYSVYAAPGSDPLDVRARGLMTAGTSTITWGPTGRPSL